MLAASPSLEPQKRGVTLILLPAPYGRERERLLVEGSQVEVAGLAPAGLWLEDPPCTVHPQSLMKAPQRKLGAFIVLVGGVPAFRRYAINAIRQPLNISVFGVLRHASANRWKRHTKPRSQRLA